jgi:hypothetical protein
LRRIFKIVRKIFKKLVRRQRRIRIFTIFFKNRFARRLRRIRRQDKKRFKVERSEKRGFCEKNKGYLRAFIEKMENRRVSTERFVLGKRFFLLSSKIF